MQTRLSKECFRFYCIVDWGKFVHRVNSDRIIRNGGAMVLKAILHTYISWKFCNQQTKLDPETTFF